MRGSVHAGDAEREIRAIVLVGGLGTRLRSVVADRPKPMGLIGKRPFLAYVVDHLRAQRVRRITLAIGHRGEVVREYFDSGNRFGVEITYSDEGDARLGTGGAVARALRAGATARYLLLLNGDSYIAFDLGALRARLASVAARMVIVAARVSDVARYGGLTLTETGEVRGFQEKGRQGAGVISAGVYLTTPEALGAALPGERRFSFETDVLRRLAGHGLYAVVSDAPFVDIGVPEDFRRAHELLSGRA